MKWSIANDFDPETDISPDADPVILYLDYLTGVREGAVGDIGFVLEDFKQWVLQRASCFDAKKLRDTIDQTVCAHNAHSAPLDSAKSDLRDSLQKIISLIFAGKY